jgi:hypothetical protein
MNIHNLVQPEFFFISGKSFVMKSMQKPGVQTEIRANITSYFGGSIRNFTVEELFQWENYYLTWADEMPANRPEDPREILKLGKGKCQEYAYLFASACVATGRDVKLMVCMKSDLSEGYHSWNQVIVNGSWIDVDSSLSKVNSLTVYHGWDWWGSVGEDCFIYSFDLNGTCKDATGDFICTY